MERAPAAIETAALTKCYRGVTALDCVSLRVPRGAVYGLLGRNGAGKSTLLQILLGLQERTSGSVKVLGGDLRADGPRLRARIGYVPERLPIYDWMTVSQVLRFVAPFYLTWDAALAERLLGRFDLPPAARVGRLSRGMRAQLCLVLALSYRPELLLLDECTAGLDPVVRREFAQRIIETAGEAGRTVLFASHQVAELERFCDWVGILAGGKLLVQEPLERLHARVKRLHFTFTGPETELHAPGVLADERHGRFAAVTVSDYNEALPAAYAASGRRTEIGMPVEVEDLGLEEIFVALAGVGGNGHAIENDCPVLERMS